MEEAVTLFNSELNNLALNLYLHGCGSAIRLKGFGNLEEDGGRRVMFGLSERIIAFIYLMAQHLACLFGQFSSTVERGLFRKRVNVKKFPKCSIPIQLSEGCPHMTCICKFEFCWTCLSPWTNEHVEMPCEASTSSSSSGESDDISEAVFLSEAEIYYKRLFSLRAGQYLKWICAFAHQHRLDVVKFVGIKEEAEQQLEGLISCAVASASTKIREVELLSCTKKTRKSYDNMVAKRRWDCRYFLLVDCHMAEKRQGKKSVALEPYALEKAGDIRVHELKL
ncbi:hypothetical protein DY000_02010391 [Brassica cretica]|uniref:RING-type domain-containing protein n=1 Tax=Brassica cretica TaxID=69181 RepID=A0ABQ7BT63_BRACR|nr:hypothetical protein DY000_02010391 [Brassica cretica]